MPWSAWRSIRASCRWTDSLPEPLPRNPRVLTSRRVLSADSPTRARRQEHASRGWRLRREWGGPVRDPSAATRDEVLKPVPESRPRPGSPRRQHCCACLTSRSRINVSAHQRPRTITAAAVWCSACWAASPRRPISGPSLLMSNCHDSHCVCLHSVVDREREAIEKNTTSAGLSRGITMWRLPNPSDDRRHLQQERRCRQQASLLIPRLGVFHLLKCCGVEFNVHSVDREAAGGLLPTGCSSQCRHQAQLLVSRSPQPTPLRHLGQALVRAIQSAAPQARPDPPRIIPMPPSTHP